MRYALICLSLLLAPGCTEEPPPTDTPPPKKVMKAPPQEDKMIPMTVNKAPRVERVLIQPGRFTAHEDIRAEVVASDPEGQPIDIDYQWFINEREILHRTAESLPASEFVKGDEIKLVVTVDDGEQETVKEYGPVTVANAPPLFLTETRALTKIDGVVVRASDPDDEPVTFKLDGEPAGMAIDSSSGRLSYKGSQDEPGGAYKVSIIAEDPDGDSVRWTFGIEISPGSKAAAGG